MFNTTEKTPVETADLQGGWAETTVVYADGTTDVAIVEAVDLADSQPDTSPKFGM